jgi:hypothetical protein
VFYVVADQAAGRIKFGFTSGDPQPRLARHRASGYRTVVRLVVCLRGDTAPAIEQAVLAALRLADIAPLHGRFWQEAHPGEGGLKLGVTNLCRHRLSHLLAS